MRRGGIGIGMGLFVKLKSMVFVRPCSTALSGTKFIATSSGVPFSSSILKQTLIPSSSTSTSMVPWSLSQRRGVKVTGTEVRTGNIVQRKGRIYQVIKAQHTQHGRGGASIQVELRDVDSGNKVTERFRTDEAIERVYVEEKTFQYLYSEEDVVVLTDPETFEQIEVAKELFGKAAVYLKDDMTVRVQYYDGRSMSATVPYRVTCTVVEAQAPMKGLSVNAQYKKVVLDNGLTVLAPPFIVIGDAIVINTADDSYITR
ncbi:uncharacterized protein LOC104889839 isoform X2 [Beta vulgaris subsp. vulgaris]|nr:uncharacterized protein LOC104889839 isoform X2 [Beta vulgaris subsp. vulgaris]